MANLFGTLKHRAAGSVGSPKPVIRRDPGVETLMRGLIAIAREVPEAGAAIYRLLAALGQH